MIACAFGGTWISRSAPKLPPPPRREDRPKLRKVGFSGIGVGGFRPVRASEPSRASRTETVWSFVSRAKRRLGRLGESQFRPPHRPRNGTPGPKRSCRLHTVRPTLDLKGFFAVKWSGVYQHSPTRKPLVPQRIALRTPKASAYATVVARRSLYFTDCHSESRAPRSG